MRLKEAQQIADGVRKHLAAHGIDVSPALARNAVAVGLGDVSWNALRTTLLTPPSVEAADLLLSPSLEVLRYLGSELADEWGHAVTAPNAYGKLFVVVADESVDARKAAALTSVVLSLKGRSVQKLDFSSLKNRSSVEDSVSMLAQSGGDTAVLSGLEDGEDYDALWSLLRANWQVLVQVDGAQALSRLFSRACLHADSKVMGRMLGVKRNPQTAQPVAYLY